ncbi:MAG: hypothetical protein KIS96_14450 [Bauldia sp.]|nr:hypothetical protein [Bauldia sp.]
MFGKDDRETMDKMAKALTGYRQRDAAVPERADAYSAFQLDQVPEAIRGHIGDLAKDPLFGKVAAVAHAEKIPVPVFQKLTSELYRAAQEAGILEAHIDPAAERTALLPEAAKNLSKDMQDRAIDARLKQNEDFVKLMTTQGLDKDVAEHGLLMLMDTAKGNRLIEFFAGKMTGGDRTQPNTLPGSPGGSLTADGLRARRAMPENTPGDRKFNQASYDALMADYKRLYPEG